MPPTAVACARYSRTGRSHTRVPDRMADATEQMTEQRPAEAEKNDLRDDRAEDRSGRDKGGGAVRSRNKVVDEEQGACEKRRPGDPVPRIDIIIVSIGL